MKKYLGYIRVSTARQGEGSSLQEQRAAIEAFAARQNLTISTWFEETETAAKLGRRAFNRMLADVERGRAEGVIIHKIDRGARNLKDWARLGELMDRGIEVYFAHDNLDLNTRGGRLAADLQAVVAADYIRNLRDEVKKGIYGRLKQGFYPFAAPRGYLDRGKARFKAIDPEVAPLVREAFELYGTGNHSLLTLQAEMARLGLRSKAGTPLSLDALSKMLHNPFYVGLLRLKSTGEVFEGGHQPLIPRALFDRVEAILDGRLFPRFQVHRYLFRRLVKCARCKRSLTGERQKGTIYYRCHDMGCKGVSVRESDLDTIIRQGLGALQLSEQDIRDFREILASQVKSAGSEVQDQAARVARDLALVQSRFDRLTDAMIDGSIDKAAYDERRAALISQRLTLREREREPQASTFWQKMAERFELGFVALQSYERGNDDEKREIVKTICSNFFVDGKKPVVAMQEPFEALRQWVTSNICGPNQSAVRKTARTLLEQVRRDCISLAQL